MHLKNIAACLTAGLLMACDATAENYHCDNVVMGGGGFVTGNIAISASYRWLDAGRRRPAR